MSNSSLLEHSNMCSMRASSKLHLQTKPCFAWWKQITSSEDEISTEY